MANTVRPTIVDVALSSFAQSASATAIPTQPEMVGQKNKTVAIQGPYSANQSSTTTDVIGVGADYGLWNYTASAPVDVNSTNFKDPA